MILVNVAIMIGTLARWRLHRIRETMMIVMVKKRWFFQKLEATVTMENSGTKDPFF